MSDEELLDFIFLSTPSSQRATVVSHDGSRVLYISIHALFAEGDRDKVAPIAAALLISIHALFAEGDQSQSWIISAGC